MSANPNDERELISLWKSGDERAFNQLFKLHFYKLFKFASRYIHDAELAKEIAMDVMFKAWQKKDELANDRPSLQPFLFHLLKAVIIDQFRKKSLHILPIGDMLTEPASIERADDLINYRELTQLYQESLNSLSPQRRLVFEMRQQQGMSYQEIADELNISSKTVNRHLTDSFHTVRKFMRKFR
ncbi:RNA polymerase sigma factor [Pedobacter psychroterrae]|uniref:Sigma-70 family RNA polymerase sigma factor n=1 Tax=Pedobacter psychroterrae TaxID=2530453 RepID=A0A4R0NSB8_9SPHI|nr:sigma-70 family RNA polymerase sigma factor [Pedobacter psychroterrae]TCD03019.1 sigma-70 family RNA polymerase sigma factor [Pedobacter psychroterrae]